MSVILSTFGYKPFDLEVNIHGLAEDISELSDLMKEVVKFKSNVVGPWETIMEIWASIVSIVIAFLLMSYISKWRKGKFIGKITDRKDETNLELDEKSEKLESEKICTQSGKENYTENPIEKERELNYVQQVIEMAMGENKKKLETYPICIHIREEEKEKPKTVQKNTQIKKTDRNESKKKLETDETCIQSLEDNSTEKPIDKKRKSKSAQKSIQVIEMEINENMENLETDPAPKRVDEDNVTLSPTLDYDVE